MESTEYINALRRLEAACAEMILVATRFECIHLPAGNNQIFDNDEWGASVSGLAAGVDNLRESINETCKQFYIKTGGQ